MFLVRRGFALNEVRTLYVDEFREFYNELVYNLELSGELQEGSYDKVKGIDRTSENLSKLFSKVKINNPNKIIKN